MTKPVAAPGHGWLARAVVPEQLLRVFHRETRVPVRAGTDVRPVEVDGLVRRELDLTGGFGNRVESPEGLGPDPDAWDDVIARQREFFAARGQQVEWKTYDYDEPADLGERLARAGFVRQDDEALLLGQARPLAEQDLRLPDGVTVRAADRDEDFDRIRQLLESVWGREQAWVTTSLLPTWRTDGPVMDVVLVEESRVGPVLCAARSEYDESSFTGLWGGSTRASWRGHGLYRATLLHRARLGLDRGKEYVRVDASPDSEPILRRLGLHRVATTTPYVFDPATRGAGAH